MLTRYVRSHTARLLREPGAVLACATLVVASVVAFLAGVGDCSRGQRPGAYGAFAC